MADEKLSEIANVHFLLTKLGWPQSKLAARAGTDPGLLSRFFAQKTFPSHITAARLSLALGRKPSELFPSLFSPDEFDPFWLTETPRKTPFKKRPLSDLDKAKIQLMEDESSLTSEQCFLLSEAAGYGPNVWRLFPTRFDRMGNLIPKKSAYDVKI